MRGYATCVQLPWTGQRRRAPRGELTRDLARLRLLAILAPLGFVFLCGYLVRGPFAYALQHFPGWLYLFIGVSAGVLAFSFFVFALIERLERRVLERSDQLGALLAVGQAASSSLRLEDLLDAALDAIVSVSSAETAEVWLVRDGELVLERLRGAELAAFAECRVLPLSKGPIGRVAQTGKPLVVHGLATEAHALRLRVVELGFHSYCAFPLRRRTETLGVLGVAARDPHALADPAERRLLEGIGEQVAAAIDNARLHARVLDAVVLKERERLARELHDGLAQVLGYVNTQTLAIKKLLATGRGAEAERQVAEMEATARNVYTDVREAILGLRTKQRELVPTLHAYVSEYARLNEIDAVVEVADGVDALRLPPAAEIQLVRIVQEALTNVRKHAHAERVVVRIGADDDALVVEISDDGRGLPSAQPRRTGWPHFGLQTMRERTESIGGIFALDSTQGAGTCVRVKVPTVREGEVAGARVAS